MARELDDVDRGILYLLQLDARNTTSQDIAEKVGVSASTIRNRIKRLEEDGVIKGYHPEIGYEAANLSFRVMFVITAPPQRRGNIVDQLMDVKGVIDVREMLTGRRNIHAEVVGGATKDIVRITDTIHDMDAEIESSQIIRQRQTQPFNHFYFAQDLEDVPEQDQTTDTE